MPTSNGPGAGLLIYLKLCGFASIVLTSPFWLYQIWAFILPGLHARERKWTRVFASIAGPLFMAGIALGYFTLPKGLEILIGFNPDGLTNLVDFDGYLSFFSRTLFVFGIAFEIPLFVVLLNLAGVVKGKSLGATGPGSSWGLHLRRDRHAVGRPVHDDADGRPDGRAVPGLRGDRPVQRPSARRRTRYADLDPDEASPSMTVPRPRTSTPRPPRQLGTCPVTWTPTSGCTDHLVRGSCAPPTATRSPATCSRSTRPTRPRWPTTRCGCAPTRPGGTARSTWPSYDGRLTVLVPGTVFTADLVLEAVARSRRPSAPRRGLRRPPRLG